MHLELVLPRLRRSSKLHLQRHNLESRLAIRIERLLVKSTESKRRHGDLALSGIRKEDVPSWSAIASEVWCVCQRYRVLFWFLLLRCEVTFRWIRIEEVFGFDWRDVRGAWWDEAGFDDELDQG